MDNASVVSDLDTSQIVLGVAVSKQLISNGAATKKAARNNTVTMDLFHSEGIPSAAVASPYDNGGKKLKKEFRGDDVELPTFTLHGEVFTNVQVYDALRLSVAKGYCSPTEWSVYTMAAGETATAKLEATRTDIIKSVQNRLTSIRRGVERREVQAQAEADQIEAQDAEEATAKAEGRDMKILPLSDFLPVKGANDKKAPRDAANDNIVNSIRVLTKEEAPEFDNTGAIASLRAALVCLNLEDPTLDENDDANK